MKLKKFLAAATISLLGTVAITVAPASATVVNTWGHWAFLDESTTTEGSITFGTGQVNATWDTDGDMNYSVEINDATDEYFDSSTPIGSAFSANGPSSDNNFGRFYVPAGFDNGGEMNITFDTPVPADALALAISDIDSDEVTVSATTDGTTPLTAEELKGTAATSWDSLSFNFCANRNDTLCSNDQEVAPVDHSRDNAVIFGDIDNDSLWGTDGTSAWLRPSVAVKTLHLVFWNSDSNNDSSERIFLVQKSGTADVPSNSQGDLANTGGNSQDGLVIAVSLVMVGMALRVGSAFRRRGEARHRG